MVVTVQKVKVDKYRDLANVLYVMWMNAVVIPIDNRHTDMVLFI